MLRLIVARCPLDGVDEGSHTGMMYVSFEGRVDIVDALTGTRAAVDTQDGVDEGSHTGLMYASQEGHLDIVKTRIGARAAVRLRWILRMRVVTLH